MHTNPNGIEFDPDKAAANLRKHGVSFTDAATVLNDPEALIMEDDSEGEARYLAVGMDASGRVLTVVYTVRGAHIRLISARRATAKERAAYAQ
ncbi:BrnT family toxin [Dokdonella soli]|uniref:BrnT family toxin n=1 Tax=Dokdonella soli TaxID=529810 RepID=A0ABN1IX24_9GAMM